MHSFNSVDEVIAHLKNESLLGERFSSRFILVHGCENWPELIQKLTYEVDRVLHLSDFCSGPDCFPDLEQLKNCLQKEIQGCKSIAITPLAENIRLDPDSAEVIRSLAEWPSDQIRRIYIPLLAADDFFHQEMNRLLRWRAGELPQPWILQGEGAAEVIAAPFTAVVRGQQVVEGIKAYLALWESGSGHRVWLKTSMAQWLPVRQVRSECRVRLYPSSFAYVQDCSNWDGMKSTWGSNDCWEWLAEQINDNDTFESLAARILNVAGFSEAQLFGLWNGLSKEKRWLVWLWSKAQVRTDSYLFHVIQKSESVEHLAQDAIMTIFSRPPSPKLSKERRSLLKQLGVRVMSSEFWDRYKDINSPLEKIAVLSGLSVEEREHICLIVGKLLTKHEQSLWWDYLETSDFDLAAYLQPVVTGDEFVDHYFQLYNRCRLMDDPDEKLNLLVNEWSERQLLWGYPARSNILEEQRSKGARIVWVDAMGLEWTGLLSALITRQGQIECETLVAKCKLPTTTEANKEWPPGEHVERGLDDVGHHYQYRYPQSFLKSMEVIENVAHKVLAILEQHTTVVITSDHGLSRFAVTSEKKFEAPEGAEIKPPGRYALVTEANTNVTGPWIMDNNKIFLTTHGRFKGGGACHGEVHGGATPEEYLSPVIIVRKAQNNTPLKFELLTNRINLNAKGAGKLIVRSNRKTSSVELRVTGQVLAGQTESNNNWSFALSGWKSGIYVGKIFSSGQFICDISFELIKGMMTEDMGI